MLLFNGGEILKIGDMGLSKVIGEESMTATKGTMKYMSPGNLLFFLKLFIRETEPPKSHNTSFENILNILFSYFILS